MSDREVFNRIAKDHNFDYNKKRAWLIYCANARVCPECKASAGRACLDMRDVKRKKSNPRAVKWPHEKRMDYARLFAGLILRGYVTETRLSEYRETYNG